MEMMHEPKAVLLKELLTLKCLYFWIKMGRQVHLSLHKNILMYSDLLEYRNIP